MEKKLYQLSKKAHVSANFFDIFNVLKVIPFKLIVRLFKFKVEKLSIPLSIENNICNDCSLICVWHGGEHFFGKDTYIYYNEKKVHIYQNLKKRKAKKSTKGVFRYEKALKESLKKVSFQIPKVIDSNTLYFESDAGYRELLFYSKKNIKRILRISLDISSAASSEVFLDKLYFKRYLGLVILHSKDGVLRSINKNIRNDLVDIINKLGKDYRIKLNLSHGDFSKWNILFKKDDIKLIDWEWVSLKTPMYDACHFLDSLGWSASEISHKLSKEFDVSDVNAALYTKLYYMEKIIRFSYISMISYNVSRNPDSNDINSIYIKYKKAC
ncbi:phosphotransferase family protein [Leucothrix pacifica]|uniref:non-specific serine/threonine protein kinase n=1 Tax=Leucothrix pacifica TaxID=1247513 RepID=A0A317CHN2_9GAMM|nr:RIO1 family regulatory kinase/ATPase [Leucothrix pacifica]PWQ95800.1 hypothetical protein DKW60_13945 [Leucothrix pacifica]